MPLSSFSPGTTTVNSLFYLPRQFLCICKHVSIYSCYLKCNTNEIVLYMLFCNLLFLFNNIPWTSFHTYTNLLHSCRL